MTAFARSPFLPATLGLLAATPAAAQSLTTFEFANGSVLQSYGQIDEAYLYYDDGFDERGFAPVGNSNSSTRAGVTYTIDPSDSSSLEFRGEFQYIPRPSAAVNFEDPNDRDTSFDRDNLRVLQLRYRNDRLGTLFVGQGSMASDNIAEIDLSGTTVTAYSAIADTAGGFFFRETGGAVSDVTTSRAYSNLDGSRRLRVRYDTPDFAGFSLSAAYGEDWIVSEDDNTYTDAALRYALETEIVQVQAGIGYNWVGVEGGDDREFWSGSASALHKPTGLNLTLATGENVAGRDGQFLYTKLGLTRDYIPLGATSLAVDFGRGQNFVDDDGELTTWALAAVQDWDRVNAQVFLLYRNQGFDDTTAEFEDGSAYFTGIRWRF